MLYRFRINSNPDFRDSAQGWVVTTCELQARELLGPHAYLQRMASDIPIDVPDGTVIFTSGALS
jgi:hypothetical protein